MLLLFISAFSQRISALKHFDSVSIENRAYELKALSLNVLYRLESSEEPHAFITPLNVLKDGDVFILMDFIDLIFGFEEVIDRRYFAKEANDDVNYDTLKADIYSLGATIKSIQNSDYESDYDCYSSTQSVQVRSDSFDDFVNLMMDCDPKKRPSIKELRSHKWLDVLKAPRLSKKPKDIRINSLMPNSNTFGMFQQVFIFLDGKMKSFVLENWKGTYIDGNRCSLEAINELSIANTLSNTNIRGFKLCWKEESVFRMEKYCEIKCLFELLDWSIAKLLSRYHRLLIAKPDYLLFLVRKNAIHVLRALSYMHSFRVFHLNITMENILVKSIDDVNSDIKLSDFKRSSTSVDTNAENLGDENYLPEDALSKKLTIEALDSLIKCINSQKTDCYSIIQKINQSYPNLKLDEILDSNKYEDSTGSGKHNMVRSNLNSYYRSLDKLKIVTYDSAKLDIFALGKVLYFIMKTLDPSGLPESDPGICFQNNINSDDVTLSPEIAQKYKMLYSRYLRLIIKMMSCSEDERPSAHSLLLEWEICGDI
eukprot:NODE_122_length_18870_cov_0.236908.p1 type:complete len:539 gc:universal NODE_122_length_18870_cov_0.236908:3307-4923(+)